MNVFFILLWNGFKFSLIVHTLIYFSSKTSEVVAADTQISGALHVRFSNALTTIEWEVIRLKTGKVALSGYAQNHSFFFQIARDVCTPKLRFDACTNTFVAFVMTFG